MRTSSASFVRGAFALVATALSLAAQTPGNGQFFLYAGTSTNRSTSKGIYLYRFDSNSGKTEALGLAVAPRRPTTIRYRTCSRMAKSPGFQACAIT
jgi:hypothetical protein